MEKIQKEMRVYSTVLIGVNIPSLGLDPETDMSNKGAWQGVQFVSHLNNATSRLLSVNPLHGPQSRAQTHRIVWTPSIRMNMREQPTGRATDFPVMSTVVGAL